MANYAFFRPTSFTQTSNFDQFQNSRNAYDIGNDTYCKTDTDGSCTNNAHGSGLTFVPYSQSGPYTRHLSDYFGQYTISETLPQGAIITGVGCGIVYASQVSVFGNTPLLEIGVTRARNTDTSFYNSHLSMEPNKGNTSTRAGFSGFTAITDVNTVINCTTNWLANNVYLLYQVTGRHSSNLSSTVIHLMEIFALAQWKLPFRVSVTNGYLGTTTGNDANAIYDYQKYVSRLILPNEGYSRKNPKITFSQGNPSYSWDPSSCAFVINSLQEGVNVNIEFRKEYTITAQSSNTSMGTVTPNTITDVEGANITLTATPLTGYKFVQWNDGNKNATRTITLSNNTTYTATFEPISYTIAFNGNGATSGSVTSVAAKYASSYNLTSNSFKKIGYLFKNWNSKADGTGTSYSDKQLISNLTSKDNTIITLYAQWEFVGDINYDNLFSLSDWYTSLCGEISGSYKNTTNLMVDLEQGTINIQDISSTVTTPDAYTNYSSNSGYYHIPVVPDTEYMFIFNVEANNATDLGQFFIFYYTDTGTSNIQSHEGYRPLNGDKDICAREEYFFAWNDGKNYIYASSFKTPLDCTKISMRFGIFSQKANITFSNIYINKKENWNKTIAPSRDYIPTLTSLSSPSITGHTFNGWYTTEDYSSGAITLNGVKTQTSSLTVYSKWTPYTYTIKFDGNGANNSGIMADQSFVYNQSKTLTPNVFSRYRYRFTGWNTSEDGSGDFYEDQASIFNITSINKDIITLYAQWEFVPLEQSIFIDNLDVKKILIDSTQIIEVFKDKTVFFRPAT